VLAARSVYHSVVGYKDYAMLLKKSGLLDIRKKRYYSLQQKEGKGTLTKQEELKYIL